MIAFFPFTTATAILIFLLHIHSAQGRPSSYSSTNTQPLLPRASIVWGPGPNAFRPHLTNPDGTPLDPGPSAIARTRTAVASVSHAAATTLHALNRARDMCHQSVERLQEAWMATNGLADVSPEQQTAIDNEMAVSFEMQISWNLLRIWHIDLAAIEIVVRDRLTAVEEAVGRGDMVAAFTRLTEAEEAAAHAEERMGSVEVRMGRIWEGGVVPEEEEAAERDDTLGTAAAAYGVYEGPNR